MDLLERICRFIGLPVSLGSVRTTEDARYYFKLGCAALTAPLCRGGTGSLSLQQARCLAVALSSLYPRSAQRGEGAPPRLATRKLRDKEARRGALCSNRGDRGGLSSACPATGPCVRQPQGCHKLFVITLYHMTEDLSSVFVGEFKIF